LSSSIPHKFHGLDHLRALAISYVFLFHYFILSHGEPDWLPSFAKFGWSGVDLFFVLSGFLISSQLFIELRDKNTISVSSFFIKRFFRIIPPFLVVLALYFLLPAFPEKEGIPPAWRFLTFTQNFGLDLKNSGAFSHAWSLCVEEHFYLLLPLLLLCIQYTRFRSRSYWLIIILFFLGSAARTFSFEQFYEPVAQNKGSWVQWYTYIYYPSYNRLDGLLVGVGIAALYVFRPHIWHKISAFGNLFFILSLLILTGAYFLCYEQQTFSSSVFGFPLIALGYGCLLIAAISPGCFLFRWKSHITTFIATISYPVYLSHKGLVHMTHEYFKDAHLDQNLLLLISIITCVCGALILHVLVEKPSLALRKRILTSKQIFKPIG
jgi:peptidoglycan/LPS O-acetylase OafA/YrhL